MTEQPIRIVLKYRAIDGYTKRATFKTLKGAQTFAQKWVGQTPDLGSFYAVSGDGVGRITLMIQEGCHNLRIGDLFPKIGTPQSPPRREGLNHGI